MDPRLLKQFKMVESEERAALRTIFRDS
jgi:hypothetical protein